MLYVEELIGPDVVNTMPAETIRAFQDHGEVRDTLETGLDEARALLDELAAAGVDYDDVVETLEREGVQKFSDSFAELLDGIRAKVGRGRPPTLSEHADAANPLEEGLGVRRKPDPCALVIFGASGDLTQRKLFPALYALAYRRLLPERFAVVGVARTEQTTAQFVAAMRKAVQATRARSVQHSRSGSSSRDGLRYVAADFADEAAEDDLDRVVAELEAKHGLGGQPRLLPRDPAAGVRDERPRDRRAAGPRGLDAGHRREAVRPRRRVGAAS